ncbi:MAG: hypothetical protein FJX76_26880, partial [Armatimonadetes bacterium]|nr:hypothetical protein [Armatimonadota bacterium]
MRPRTVAIERDAADTPLARRLRALPDVEIHEVERWRPQGIGLENLRAAEVKSTLVVKRFHPIRFEYIDDLGDCLFHLARGCPLHCAYCSLTYRVPARPYIEVFANVDEILAALDRLREEMARPLRFIIGDYSDVLAVEPWTGSLRQVIAHFAAHHQGRSRLEFLTKSDAIAPLLEVDPAGTTWCGYSISARTVEAGLERGVAPVETRLACLRKAVDAGYHPLVNIAPVLHYPGWREEHAALLDDLATALRASPRFDERTLRVECEAHWQKAMEFPILERMYPGADLGLLRLGKEERPGVEGTAVFVYSDEAYAEMSGFFAEEI